MKLQNNTAQTVWVAEPWLKILLINENSELEINYWLHRNQ